MPAFALGQAPGEIPSALQFATGPHNFGQGARAPRIPSPSPSPTCPICPPGDSDGDGDGTPIPDLLTRKSPGTRAGPRRSWQPAASPDLAAWRGLPSSPGRAWAAARSRSDWAGSVTGSTEITRTNGPHPSSRCCSPARTLPRHRCVADTSGAAQCPSRSHSCCRASPTAGAAAAAAHGTRPAAEQTQRPFLHS